MNFHKLGNQVWIEILNAHLSHGRGCRRAASSRKTHPSASPVQRHKLLLCFAESVVTFSSVCTLLVLCLVLVPTSGGQPHTHTSRTKHCSAERQLTKHSFVNYVCSCDPLESLLIRGTKDQSYKPYRLTDPGALTSEVGSEGKGVGSGEEEDWEGRVGSGEL